MNANYKSQNQTSRGKIKDIPPEDLAYHFVKQFHGRYTKEALEMPEKFREQQLFVISTPQLEKSLAKLIKAIAPPKQEVEK